MGSSVRSSSPRPFGARRPAACGCLAAIRWYVCPRADERYGERETVSRRVRYVLRSYVDWGVLNESEANGVYDAGLSLAIDDPRLIGWLIEASLQATINRSGPLRELIASPRLFPFRLQRLQAEILLATCSLERMLVTASVLQNSLLTSKPRIQMRLFAASRSSSGSFFSGGLPILQRLVGKGRMQRLPIDD